LANAKSGDLLWLAELSAGPALLFANAVASWNEKISDVDVQLVV